MTSPPGRENIILSDVALPHAVLTHGTKWKNGPIKDWNDIASKASEHGKKVTANGLERTSWQRLTDAQYLEATPTHGLKFGRWAGYVVAVSFGWESLRGCLVDANGDVVIDRYAPSVEGRFKLAPDTVMAQLRALVIDILTTAFEQNGATVPTGDRRRGIVLQGVAVAFPFPIDRSSKKATGWLSRHRSGWDSQSMEDWISQALRINVDRCHAHNDANAAAFAAAFDVCRENPEENILKDEGQVVLSVRVGGGLGAGSVIIGSYHPVRSAFLTAQLIEGKDGFAGEIGHLKISRARIQQCLEEVAEQFSDDVGAGAALGEMVGERPCSCGHASGPNGLHLEAVVSASAALDRIERSDGIDVDEMIAPLIEAGITRKQARLDPDTVSEAIRVAEKTAVGHRALLEVGYVLGAHLESAILFLNPLTLCLVGSCARPAVEAGVAAASSAWHKGGPTEVQRGVTQRYDPGAHGDPVPHPLIRSNDDPYVIARGAGIRVMLSTVWRRIDDLAQRPSDMTVKTWVQQSAPVYTVADLELLRDGGRSYWMQ